MSPSFFSSFFSPVYSEAAPAEDKEEEKPEESSQEEKPEGDKEGGDDEESSEESPAEEEEEEDEPEDLAPAIREKCQTTKCAAAAAHFEHCQEKVQNGEGFKGEDCVEEMFHMMHCIDECAGPALFSKLK